MAHGRPTNVAHEPGCQVPTASTGGGAVFLLRSSSWKLAPTCLGVLEVSNEREDSMHGKSYTLDLQ